MTRRRTARFVGVAVIAVQAAAWNARPAAAQGGYIAQALVASTTGYGTTTIDPNLVNPWGMSASATGPWWLSDNGTGLSTLYNGTGGIIANPKVTIPLPTGGSGTATPTGQVFNSTTADFKLTNGNGNKANFLFATEDGTISGWNTGSTALLEVDRSGAGAVYKGLALGNVGASNYLYAADFANNAIDVFDTSFTKTTLAGSFVDPNAVAGYAPFNIQSIGGSLYVTYAQQDTSTGNHDELDGSGLGFVDKFDMSGNFLGRFATGTGAGGTNADIDAPWGIALAPSNFGTFSSDLLIGNFGSGTIMAFNATTGAYQGLMSAFGGGTVAVDGLWGLAFGNGGTAGPATTLYYTAGPNSEADGVYGRITAAAPEPSSFLFAAFAMGPLGLLLTGGRRAARVSQRAGRRLTASAAAK